MQTAAMLNPAQSCSNHHAFSIMIAAVASSTVKLVSMSQSSAELLAQLPLLPSHQLLCEGIGDGRHLQIPAPMRGHRWRAVLLCTIIDEMHSFHLSNCNYSRSSVLAGPGPLRLLSKDSSRSMFAGRCFQGIGCGEGHKASLGCSGAQALHAPHA